MKNSGLLIGGIIVAVLILAFFFIKTKVSKLADGSTIYKRGMNYYLNIDGNEVKIDANEYNRLLTHVEGSCTAPGTIATQDVTPCTYMNKYKGYLNDCGDCQIATPVQRVCDPKGAACTSGGKPGVLTLTGSDAKNCNYSCYTYEQ